MLPNAFERVIKWTSGDIFKVIIFSDVHFGCGECDETAFKKMISENKDDDKVYYLCLGDLYDAIIAKDKRFRRSILHHRYVGIDNVIGQAIDEVVDILKPISNNILGISSGNHEDTYLINSGFDILEETCKKLTCPYLGYDFFYHLKFIYDSLTYKPQTRLVKIYGHHGYGGGTRTEGGSMTKYSKALQWIDADILSFAHDHQKYVDFPIQLSTRMSGEVISKRRILCNSGTFQKTLTDSLLPSWAEKKLYPPREVGYVTITIKPYTKGWRQTELHAWC